MIIGADENTIAIRRQAMKSRRADGAAGPGDIFGHYRPAKLRLQGICQNPANHIGHATHADGYDHPQGPRLRNGRRSQAQGSHGK